MAVKRIANLGAQRVARAEAARLDAERLSGGEQSVPNVPDGFVRTDDFESVFAGVAGARDEHAAMFKVKTGDLVFLQYRSRLFTRMAETEAPGMHASMNSFTRGPCTATAA